MCQKLAYIIIVPLKGNITLTFFSQVNWSTRGEQRVEEMANHLTRTSSEVEFSSYSDSFLILRVTMRVLIRKLDTLLCI